VLALAAAVLWVVGGRRALSGQAAVVVKTEVPPGGIHVRQPLVPVQTLGQLLRRVKGQPQLESQDPATQSIMRRQQVLVAAKQPLLPQVGGTAAGSGANCCKQTGWASGGDVLCTGQPGCVCSNKSDNMAYS